MGIVNHMAVTGVKVKLKELCWKNDMRISTTEPLTFWEILTQTEQGII